MSLLKQRFKILNINFKHNNWYGLMLIAISSSYSVSAISAIVEDVNQRGSEAEFDSGFLYGKIKDTDLSGFKFSNPIVAGEYDLDVYVNERWQGRQKINFKSQAADQHPRACFRREQLLNYGVKATLLDQKHQKHQEQEKAESCQALEDWLQSAFYNFDSNALRIDISIAQVALSQTARDIVDQQLWDRGIDAAYLSYSGGAYKIRNPNQPTLDKSQVFMGINSGINLAGWQLRHQGQWNSTQIKAIQALENSHLVRDSNNNKAVEHSKSHYQSVNSYLQRAFAQYRGVLTLGDYYSSGDIFDSVSYRGVDFSSDERMLPNSASGYAPQIRGVAKTHAKVEIRQQGQLIYQTTVASGPFEIKDLYPTGFAGELNVQVLESNGEIQSFSVPYASVIQMLRPGLDRYAITIGQYRDRQINSNPWLIQAKYFRGLNNVLTGYSGLQWAKNYNALSMGAAVGTVIGALAMDLTHATTTHFNRQTQSGQSYRLSYSKLISPSATHLSLAAYRYSTAHYFNLRNAILIYDLDQKGLSTAHIGKPRHEYQVTLNQNLPRGWGNIYGVYALTDYWNKAEKNNNYTFGYSQQYKFLNYGVTAIRRRLSTQDNISKQQTEYVLSLSFPLDISMKNIYVNSMQSKSHRMLSINASLNERFDYSATFQHQDRSNPSANLNGQYRTPVMALGAGVTFADDYQQAYLNMRGNVVAHAGGVLFGAGDAQTMALVYAPHAVGARVNQSYGLQINRAGYAVIPYLTPYRFNDVELDPSDMLLDVELEESSQRVVPYAGAILKVDFATKTGHAIFIKSRLANGEAIPFYAAIYNAEDELVAHVAQGGLVYFRSKTTQGRLKVQLNSVTKQYCFIDYDISAQKNTLDHTVYMTEAVCQS